MESNMLASFFTIFEFGETLRPKIKKDFGKFEIPTPFVYYHHTIHHR
jgi:hypothetical protein